MKSDYPPVFGRRPYSKDLDYVALWFVKGADYIEGTKAELAFVATNSVSQGEHVGLMFPMIFAKKIEIGYAYTSFKWENSARRNAGVSVVVVNLRKCRSGQKYIYSDGIQIVARNINGYLADASPVFVYRRTKALSSSVPRMALGSMPKDGGHLILDPSERDGLIAQNPRAETFVKRYMGSAEFINDIERYCLWIEDQDLVVASTIQPIAQRLEAVARWRRSSSAQSTVDYAAHPNRFRQNAYRATDAVVIPSISSERRDYIPIGFVGPETVISSKAFTVNEAEPWIFTLLTSRMHMVWTQAVSGRLETRIQYGAYIVYNNFPVPTLSSAAKERMTIVGLRVLDVREYHCEKTLADLYDPDHMPPDLRAAHEEVDALVDSIYSRRGYESDEQRLSGLFAMYEAMTADEATRETKK